MGSTSRITFALGWLAWQPRSRGRANASGTRRLIAALLSLVCPACAATAPPPPPSSPQAAERVRTPIAPPAASPASAATALAESPVAPAVPGARRVGLAEAFEGLDLYRREVADLALSPELRRQVELLFEGVTAWWKPIRAEFDAGQPPPEDRIAALSRRIEETRARVQAMLGPERALALAARRRTPRGAGRLWASKLRMAIESAGVTRGQSAGVEAAFATLHAGIDELPASEPADERTAVEMRQRVQGLIDTTRGKLGDVLTPAQMAELVRRVPTLARPVPKTAATSSMRSKT